jgi:cell division protein FtsB
MRVETIRTIHEQIAQLRRRRDELSAQISKLEAMKRARDNPSSIILPFPRPAAA